MLKAVLIDDEETGRNILAELLIEHCHDLAKIVGQADNASDGYTLIQELKPDIVFLDIEMYGENGFDLLDKFDEIDFDVIFTTAYSRYSIKAIRYAALDYLLKPVLVDELVNAVQRVGKKESKQARLQYTNLLKSLKFKDTTPRIAVPDIKGLTFIEVHEIVRCESKNNYTIIFLKNGEHIYSSKAMKDYEDLLKDGNFFRVHNCHLINLTFIKRYEKGEGGTLILKDNTEIEVSRRRKQELLEKMTSPLYL